MKGKTLGVEAVGDISDLAARMMIRHFSVDPEREIKIIPIGRDRGL
ncbi:MAG: hypothetical protein HY694_09435 [Deltaproteobacteria bacterium]|nr:hypothetical protein [Deltaproteobacteria bacterium]